MKIKITKAHNIKDIIKLKIVLVHYYLNDIYNYILIKKQILRKTN